MRVRKKHWTRPELESADFIITKPDIYKGRWREEFNNQNPIYLELGCGTGKFICENADKNPGINYIGIDMKDEIIIYAKRNVEKLGAPNIRLIPININYIESVFGVDEISRIHINFCNPWPKSGQNKRRLTHNDLLEKYKKFLKPGSQIWFKTDDRGLFEDSQEYFKSSGFSIGYITYDLHSSGFEHNIMTEYEERFVGLGQPIMFLIAE